MRVKMAIIQNGPHAHPEVSGLIKSHRQKKPRLIKDKTDRSTPIRQNDLGKGYTY
jgi:hypothetical protein